MKSLSAEEQSSWLLQNLAQLQLRNKFPVAQHIPHVTPQQQCKACQYPLPARIYPRREWAVCATPEIPTGTEQLLEVNHRESFRNSPKLLIRMLFFCSNI